MGNNQRDQIEQKLLDYEQGEDWNPLNLDRDGRDMLTKFLKHCLVVIFLCKNAGT